MTDGRTKVLGTVAKRVVWREPAENNYTGDSDSFQFTIPERDDVKITVVPDNKSEPIIFLVATFGAGGVYGAIVGAGASGKKNVPAEFTGPPGTYFLKLDMLGLKPGGYDLVIERKSGVAPVIAPRVVGDTFEVPAEAVKKGIQLDVLANDGAGSAPIDSKSLTIDVPPAHGTATIKKGQVVYKPNEDNPGSDFFMYFVKGADGGRSGSAVVNLEIEPRQDLVPPATADPPRAADDNFALNAAELGKKGVALDILVNDTPLTGALNLKSAKIVDAPDNGTAAIKKGMLLYKPDPGFEGTDTLTYTVADASGRASNLAEVRIEARQPDPPRAADDRFAIDASAIGKKGAVLDILVNDTPSTGALNLKSVKIVDGPANGTASVKKGTLVYKPDPVFEGADTLIYTVADASGRDSNPAEVRIELRQGEASSSLPPSPPPLPPGFGSAAPAAFSSPADDGGTATPLRLADLLDDSNAIAPHKSESPTPIEPVAGLPPPPNWAAIVTPADDPATVV